MKKDSYLNRIFVLFITFAKLGALTFGGGYGMIPVIEEEISRKKKWMTEMEILDIITIGESTPGPIAVNIATYVGYKVAGIWGGIFASLGLVLSPFLIILLISFFYNDFIQLRFFQAMFSGLKVGVILLLFSAFIRLGKKVKRDAISVSVFIISLIASIIFTIIDTGFDYLSICLIVFGFIVGIVTTLISKKREEK